LIVLDNSIKTIDYIAESLSVLILVVL